MRALLVLRQLGLLMTLAAAVGTAALGAQTGTVAGRVTAQETGEPLAGATVAVVGQPYGAIARGDGSYRLQLRPGSYELRARLIGYAATLQRVTIVDGQTAAATFQLPRAATELEAVAVTGSRAGERTVVDAPVPVDVLSAADLKNTGRTETAQQIQMLAPSFNFPRATITDGTDHVRPATIRGLGPDQMLVLVNGKRRHNSALVNVNGSVGRGSTGVDLNAIPASMIERVEILRDGAAAQYGSDAIAGVLNIILKSTNPGDASVSTGKTTAGDGAVFASEANIGLTGEQGSFFHVGGEYRDRGFTNRTRLDPRPQYTFAGATTPDPRDLTANRLNHRQGDAKTDDVIFFFNGARSLLSGIEFYTFGGVGRRTGNAPGFFRRPNDDRTVRALHPDGFLPYIDTKIGDGSGVVGARGLLAGYRYDLSGEFGKNEFQFYVNNSNNVSLGRASPTSFDAGKFSFHQAIANLDLFREFLTAGGIPFRTAAGAEVRRERYRIYRGDVASYINGGVRILDGPNIGKLAAVGAQVFPGFQPVDETNTPRDNYALYADVETDVTKQFLLGGAARYENYSDFGATSTGKVTARFAPVQSVIVRGAYSTGFRAPSLAQSFFSSTATNFDRGLPVDVRTFPVNSPVAQALGAKPLTPETSHNISAGVALQPVRNLALTVDLYRITIGSRIVFSENFNTAGVRNYLLGLGYVVGGARFFTNAIDTRTKGFDVVFNYGASFGDNGVSRFTAGFNHNRTEVTQVNQVTPPQLGNLQATLFGRVQQSYIEEAQPRDNLVFSLVHDVRRLTVNLRSQRFGEVTVRNNSPILDQTFSAKWISDASASYRLAGGLSVSAGIDNAFNVYPDENNNPGPATFANGGNSNFGIFPYSGFSPFGFNGTYYYGRLTYAF
ncbi:MAG: TonB-dependent receptor [Gemmatimonadaceae bacterium]